MNTPYNENPRKKEFLAKYRNLVFHHELNESTLFGAEHIFTMPESANIITCRFMDKRRLHKDRNGNFCESPHVQGIMLMVCVTSKLFKKSMPPMQVFNFYATKDLQFVIETALCAGMHPMRCFANPNSAVEFFKTVGVSVSDLDIYQELKCSPKQAADSIRSALQMKASKTTPAVETIDFDFSEVLV